MMSTGSVFPLPPCRGVQGGIYPPGSATGGSLPPWEAPKSGEILEVDFHIFLEKRSKIEGKWFLRREKAQSSACGAPKLIFQAFTYQNRSLPPQDLILGSSPPLNSPPLAERPGKTLFVFLEGGHTNLAQNFSDRNWDFPEHCSQVPVWQHVVE